MFRPAQRHQKKLRCAIEGTSGSGKTMSALRLAEGLVAGDMTRVAVVDTEHQSADLYATLYEPGRQYQVLTMEAPFSPQRYMTAMRAAVDEGFAVVVIDSLSHAWMGPGGVLEIVDNQAKRSSNPNKFAAWNEGTRVQNELIEFMLALPIHLIATMRSKTVWGEEVDERGRKKPVKLGVGAQQRKEMDFEFDLVLQLDQDHVAAATKHRTQELWDGRFEVITRQHGEQLLAWLNQGDVAPPAPMPAAPAAEQVTLLGPDQWRAMVAGAAALHVTEERLRIEFDHSGYPNPQTAPLALAKEIYGRMQQAVVARMSVQDEQREQAAAAESAPAPAAAQPQPAPSSPPAVAPQPAPASPDPAAAPWAPTPGELISMNQTGQLRAMLVAKGIDERAFCSAAGIESVDRLPAAQWDAAVASVRSLPDPAPITPRQPEQPQEPPAAPAAAAPRFPVGSQADQEAMARAARRPDGCNMDTSFMECVAVKNGETPQCQGCEHFDADFAPLDAATRRDAPAEQPQWGVPRKAGSIDPDRLKRLAMQCAKLETLGVPAEKWRQAMLEQEKVVSRRELSKAAADRLAKYISRWIVDLESGTIAPSERAVA